MATLLKNCRIYDGTGSDAVNGSVQIGRASCRERV